MVTEFSEDLQRLFISFLLSDKELFVRCRNIINPAYFLINLRPSVEFIVKHADDYSALPTIDQLKAKTKLEISIDDEVTVRHKEWFLDEFSSFAKHKALEIAILESADDIEKGEYYTVEDRIKKASEVSLTKNLGTSYFEDPMARLMKIKEKRGTVSSGWNALDKKLYGGFNKGELNIFAGGSGAGKSLFLQNLALNWVLAGLNVVYVTLELSEELTAMRIDSMVTDVPTHSLFKNLENVDLKVRMTAKEAGSLQLVYMPSGVNTSQIKAFLKEYEIQSKNYAHALLVDYLDLMMPNDRRVNPTDLFVKDKYVSEELRNLAVDLDILFITASQLNRSAVEEIEFDHSHIAGGLSKVQTADNVMGIFTSAPMRERGRYQIQFMKTRSSSGVGTRIDLGFNLETLRIEDLPEGEEIDVGISEDIYSNLQRKTTVQDDERSEPEEKALELRKLIKKLGT